jgi:tripartite motif-containing protein 37
MQDEIEQLEEFHDKLNQELSKMPKTSLIKKSGDLIHQLKEINTKEPQRFVDNEVSIDFTSELVPQYEQSVFVISNFSRIRNNQSPTNLEENEIVYSDPPLVTRSGLSWRLKVYPNGNGIANGNYISVFLEMLKGLPEAQTQKYEYRVDTTLAQNLNYGHIMQ